MTADCLQCENKKAISWTCLLFERELSCVVISSDAVHCSLATWRMLSIIRGQLYIGLKVSDCSWSKAVAYLCLELRPTTSQLCLLLPNSCTLLIFRVGQRHSMRPQPGCDWRICCGREPVAVRLQMGEGIEWKGREKGKSATPITLSWFFFQCSLRAESGRGWP